jgi:uncharacterized protein (TIGR03382 family)
MRTAPAILVFAAATFTSAPSFALEQFKHRQISRDACTAAGLPEDFCERVGVEAFDVDAYEWNDLAAHAQVDVSRGQTACEAANLAADRVYGLGRDLRDGLTAKAHGESWADGQYLATQLGRALHTVQDNCAHHGISNPNHAWLSLSDLCSGTKLSPDVQPAAFACAQRETTAMIAAFERTLAEAGLVPGDLDDVAGGWLHFPSRDYACAFLKSGDAWDGIDTRWESEVAVPALHEQFVAGVGGAAVGRDVCHGDPRALLAHQVAAPIDTSHGQALCATVELYCFGKSAATGEVPPPWEEPGGSATTETGGCATAGESPVGLALMVLSFGALRRRRSVRDQP